MAHHDVEWDELVADLYLSATDPAAGARLPARFAALTGGVVASLWRLRPQDNSVVGNPATNLPAEAIAAYRAHYYQHDPWTDAIRQARYNSILRNAEIMDDDDYVRSTYYNEFGMQHEMFHLIGALVPLGAGASSNVGVISILRPRKAGEFDEAAAARLSRALPHIGAALRLQEHIDAAAAATRTEALDAALEVFGLPAVVLDGHGTIIRANPLAEGVPCLRHAMARRTNPHGMLRLPAEPGHERLPGLLAAAASGEAGGKFRLVDQTRSYVATVTPLPGRLGAMIGAPRGLVLLLLKPIGIHDRGALAQTLFKLTDAEAEVSASLIDGLTPAEIAATRGVKISTVRTLLQRAQDKADCRNLRDLVRLFASLA